MAAPEDLPDRLQSVGCLLIRVCRFSRQIRSLRKAKANDFSS
jgi:hypothetical protein